VLLPVLVCSTELQEKLPGDMDGLADSFERLQHSLQQAQDYVDAVVVSSFLFSRFLPRLASSCPCLLVLHTDFHCHMGDVPDCRVLTLCVPVCDMRCVQAGKRKGNVAIGRYLAETVATVPHYGRDEFERMLTDQQNDCTLVLFLSKLVQAHLALADKLGTMQLPLI
jgi:hypothetical protein